MTVKTKVNDWIKSRTGTHGGNLKVNLDGELIKWVYPQVYVSDVPSLEYCTYQKGLIADMFRETGDLPKPNQETKELMDSGTEGHQAVGDSLRIPSDVDFTREEVVDTPKQALEKLLTAEEAHSREFPIAGSFKDISIRGRIDHIEFSHGSCKLVEEWKFSKNGKVKSDHIKQAKIYTYLIYKWLEVLPSEYMVKVWPLGSWTKRDQGDAFEYGFNEEPPSDIVSKKFLGSDIGEVERLLSTANAFYTGRTPCSPDPGFGCSWCSVKDLCNFYEKPPSINGHVVDLKKDEVSIAFGVA